MASKKILFAIGLFWVLFSGLVFAAPGIPDRFYGEVNFSNMSAPDNLSVTAEIDGVQVAETSTSAGRYGYGQLFFVTDSSNNRSGKTIEFFVNDVKADETAVFQNGGSQRLDLTLGVPINQLTTDGKIENEQVLVAPDSLFTIIFRGNLTVVLSSDTETMATIQEIHGLGHDFYAQHPFEGRSSLVGYEIKIDGAVESSIVMSYANNLSGDIDESSIAPYKFNGVSWEPIIGFKLDKGSKTVAFKVNAASTPYALFAGPKTENLCENISCNDFNPCTTDVCSEGVCSHGALPDNTKCPNGVCKGGVCQQIEQPTTDNAEPQTTASVEPQNQKNPQTDGVATENSGLLKDNGAPEGSDTNPDSPKENTTPPTAFVTLEITPSTAIISFVVMIFTLMFSYLIFRRK